MSASPHHMTVRVYYEDTDFSGVVYHANYLRYLERGRTELLRDLGLNQAELFAGSSAQPLGFAVTQMKLDFRKPARMDDLLTVETTPVSVGRASLVLEQRVLRDAEILVEATVKVAAVCKGRVARLPADVTARLAG